MVSSRWSDITSSSTLSHKSIKTEVSAVAGVVVKERNDESLTIGVVRKQSLDELEKVCAEGPKLLGLIRRKPPPMLFTTAQGLQDTIAAIKTRSKHHILNLLVSPDVDEIWFHVPSHFDQLKVLRCAAEGTKGKLYVDGSSTYNNVRLDKWQAHRHKHHTLLLGHKRGVRIRLADIANIPNWARCRNQFTQSEQAELRQHFDTLSGKTRWNDVRGVVSAIVGLAVGTVILKIAANAAVGGVYVKYAFGFHALELGAAGAKAATVFTAAGPGVVMGVTAAAAVYFIPWESLMDWLKGALSFLWDKVCAVWERFKDWVMHLFGGHTGPRPMEFAV
ncbi:hypothetical protein GCG54_00015443 [Colletotrichum gloeosporioides]|uniref:Uncharacterized protein n=1 Tax=Colletotrichum gloeosporioides TaxID=474922 RepID=A0A8H4C9Z8_COLGL|nr:uncharacterized protein GCG54_00015443 [Colletotrichum gloeosporioides]KAF3800065.1 hypothetical protein GCG54_00015443 [Colletotrichum gloeosporioides]